MPKNWIEDTQALLGDETFNRRKFLKMGVTATGLGYAMAADPALAQAIQTDFQGIEGQEISFEVDGVKVPAYVSRPQKKSPQGWPVIVVVSEIFGVHEYIADVTRRFAKLGYLAIAPEFFVRAGDPSAYGTIAEIQKEIIGKTSDAQVMKDMHAAIAWARANGGDIKRLGVTGFCWGGRITWLASQQVQSVKAGVAWYGRLVGDKTAMTPSHPLDGVAQQKAPVLGLYGAADTGIPLETVRQMQDALAQQKNNGAAQASRFEIYPDAPHAFHADYRSSYREAVAKDAWGKCVAWFKQQGVV